MIVRMLRDSRGFTLIELTVVLGITAIMAVCVGVSIVSARRPVATAEATFKSAMSVTLSLAATNTLAGGSGAVIVVTKSGDESAITILRNRPILGAESPTLYASVTDKTAARILLEPSGAENFSFAVAPSGAVDVLPFAIAAGTAGIAAPTPCIETVDQSIRLRFSEGSQSGDLVLSCVSGLPAETDDIQLRSLT